MKKLFGLAMAAALLTLSPNTASAWHNVKFGVGMNFEWSAGNNQFHKLWSNGQIPPPNGYHMAPPMMDGFGYAPAMDHHHAQANVPESPAGNANTNATAALPGNPFHYSSYGHSGYYSQQPGYYYGQNVWYGW